MTAAAVVYTLIGLFIIYILVPKWNEHMDKLQAAPVKNRFYKQAYITIVLFLFALFWPLSLIAGIWFRYKK